MNGVAACLIVLFGFPAAFWLASLRRARRREVIPAPPERQSPRVYDWHDTDTWWHE